MKNREKALSWWNLLPELSKALLACKYKSALYGRGYDFLTGREIEAIWHQEFFGGVIK